MMSFKVKDKVRWHAGTFQSEHGIGDKYHKGVVIDINTRIVVRKDDGSIVSFALSTDKLERVS